MDHIILVSDKYELLNAGYVYDNIGREFIYENKTFILQSCGIRSIKYPIFPSHRQQALPIPREPVWIMDIGDLHVTISSIT